MINDHSICVQDGLLRLRPCAYLHNYEIADRDPLTDPSYSFYMAEAPLFRIHGKNKLRKFIQTYIRHGDSRKVIDMIEGGIHAPPNRSRTA